MKREIAFYRQRWEEFSSFLQKGIIAQLEACFTSLMFELHKVEKKKQQKDIQIKSAQAKAEQLRLKYEKMQNKVETLVN